MPDRYVMSPKSEKSKPFKVLCCGGFQFGTIENDQSELASYGKVLDEGKWVFHFPTIDN